MIANRFVASGVLCATLLLTAFAARPASAQQANYTPAEYNAYIAATKAPDAQQRIGMLDNFISKFPNSALLPYIYQSQFQTYASLKDFPNTITAADKLVALGDKAPIQTRLQALVARCQSFEASFNAKAPDAADQLKKERDAAAMGLNLLGKIPRPENVSDAQFTDSKKPAVMFFNAAAAYAALQAKDYKGAADGYKAVLAIKPDDAVSSYRLGVAYLEETPPAFMDGAWALARAIALKVPDDAKVTEYLKNQVTNYQQAQCDNLVDDQVKNLIDLASKSPDRPTTLTIPSADDLNKVRPTLTVAGIMADLQAGGDKAKTTWLAACGLTFPQVPAKIISITPSNGDFVDLQLATADTDEAIQAATVANLEAKVVGQPDASRLQKDDELIFSGTLVSYDPTPLMLHFDKAKVDPQYIPEAGKHNTRQLHKKP